LKKLFFFNYFILTASSEMNSRKTWLDREYGVLPTFCSNEQKDLGDNVSLRIREERLFWLLRIVCESNGPFCFLYAWGHPQFNSTALICSINHLNNIDIVGEMTNLVKVSHS